MLDKQSNNKADPISVILEYSCYGCRHFGREYENNDIRCTCRKSPFYLDVPPGVPCKHWRAKE